MEKIEFLILRNLLYNDDYTRKVLPFIKDEYFQDTNQRIIYDEISKFVQEYNDLPTKEILCIELEKRTDLNEESYKKTLGIISSLDDVPVDNKWLIDTTEKWCKERAIYLALMESIHIADGNSDSKSRDAIPSILSDALAVSFDNHIGHDYFEDYEDRFESYRRAEEKLPFDIEYLNKITKGGLPKKTLTIFMAPTGIGKSTVLCHLAASYLLQNKNVLYITMEMSEEKIAERIDANLLDVEISGFKDLPKKIYDSKVNNLMRKTQGSLIVKEYPTASAHCGHFKALLNELKLKKSFVPDAILVDYMNICASLRYKSNVTVNSYNYVKAIAEELRGLAVEFDVPLITATQTNRCLGLDTIVTKENGIDIEMRDIKVGDRILSSNGYVTVEKVYPIEIQDTYEITTKSDRKIVCSARHVFPSNNGEVSIENGLSIGDFLFSSSDLMLDEIVSIEYVGKRETIDITVSGNSLFYANGILTHNSGMGSSDIDITDTSDSAGSPMSADIMLALISTEELEELGQIMIKQLKNRYNDVNLHRRFVVGIDRAKMRLYDVEQSAQNEVLDTRAETSYNGDGNKKPSLKEKFGGFKFD